MIGRDKKARRARRKFPNSKTRGVDVFSVIPAWPKLDVEFHECLDSVAMELGSSLVNPLETPI
jgi:hypothetical protein